MLRLNYFIWKRLEMVCKVFIKYYICLYIVLICEGWVFIWGCVKIFFDKVILDFIRY